MKGGFLMLERVYRLTHTRTLEDDSEFIKDLGVYSTLAAAEDAKDRISKKPGFREAIEGFYIDCYPLDEDNWTEGYTSA